MTGKQRRARAVLVLTGIAAFFGLYVGLPGWVWVVAIGGIGLAGLGAWAGNRARLTSHATPVMARRGLPEGWEASLPPQVRDWLGVARDAWTRQDWPAARLAYRKCGYGNVRAQSGAAGQAKEYLIQEQSIFAEQDPFHATVIRAVQDAVMVHPGALQSEIYDTLPFDREDISSALYFGELLGQIRRVKKGRSYQLYPTDPAS